MKKRTGVVNVGTVSVFLILTVLLLVTFSVLSLVLARTDKNRSELAAQANAAYYAADARAWALVDEAAALVEQSGGEAARAALAEKNAALEQTQDGALLLTFTTPVSEALTLSSQVRLTADGGAIKIQTVCWRCVPART